MAQTNSAPAADLTAAVERARLHRDFLRGLRDIYQETDQAAGRLGAVCLGGGACCRFDLAGHRLYLSTGELAILTEAPPPMPLASGRCPYQVGPRCRAYGRRAVGCRAYFCKSDRSGRERLSEAAHGQVRRAHEEFAIPYRYVELTAGLEALGVRCPREPSDSGCTAKPAVLRTRC